ncbi:MAG TPA: P1 family peptidase [Caldilineae bacterium]|nr:P1 family peptidase [Caldilineae bacterium]
MNDTITRIPGLLVGHDTNQEARTGCTVILTPEGVTAAVDVRGAAPGTRETDLLRPENLVQQVHAILLGGGSVFGLDAATGIVQWLHEYNFGFDTGFAKVPIVPAAVLFDLAVGRSDAWPDATAGYRACENASASRVQQGLVGAGTGATVAKMQGLSNAKPGGLGSFVMDLPTGGSVGAIVAVNAVGEIVDPATGQKVVASDPGDIPAGWPAPGQNTTIGVVATDLTLTKTQCLRVAQMAHDGFARAIQPSHTLYDGDTIFALSTGVGPVGDPNLVGIFAAEVMSQAILRAVQA